jgi:hypothetical protein
MDKQKLEEIIREDTKDMTLKDKRRYFVDVANYILNICHFNCSEECFRCRNCLKEEKYE